MATPAAPSATRNVLGEIGEYLAQATDRLDGLCRLGVVDQPLYELWRAVAHINAAMKLLVAELGQEGFPQDCPQE